MKLNEIKEVGFYHEVNDLERKVIYEVMENADEDWLKEDPEATLLIDTWHYEYKDESDRDRYSVDGNLLTLYLNESDIDVVKIEDTKYKVFGESGQFLIEDKPTYKELFKHKEKECENLKAEEKYLKQCCQKAGEELAKHSFDYDGKEKNLVVQAIELNEKYEKFEKALVEIEEVINNILNSCLGRNTVGCRPTHNVCGDLIKILDITNKAKGGNNE